MQAAFHASYGHEEVEFVIGASYGSDNNTWLEFGPVPEEWKKIHAFLEESRRYHDPDDLDQSDFYITQTGHNQYKFEASFNNGSIDVGTLTVLPDGSLKLVYPKED